jgi:hypothetical protein
MTIVRVQQFYEAEDEFHPLGDEETLELTDAEIKHWRKALATPSISTRTTDTMRQRSTRPRRQAASGGG